MSQEDIVRLLRQNYPEFITREDILVRLDIARRNILNSIKQMQKYREIESIFILEKGRWVWKYREKRQ